MEITEIKVNLKKDNLNRTWVVNSWADAAKKADNFKKYRHNLSLNVEFLDGDDIVPVNLSELDGFMYTNNWDLGSRNQIKEVLKTLKKRVRELETLEELDPDQYQALIEGFDRARFGDDYD